MTFDSATHPLFKPFGLKLPTKQIAALHKTITQWIWFGATGGYIEGDSRAGKTTAVEMVSTSLKDREGNILPSMIITVPERDNKTVRAIHLNNCVVSGIPFTSRASSDALSATWCFYIAERCSQDESDTFVLFVDEMQRLIPKQFNAFAELHDKLRAMGVLLVVIFLGNRYESNELITEVQSNSFSHIRGRFFVHSTKFHGLRNKEELKQCLSLYDSTFYPLGSSISYTEHFLPQPFSNDWRLEAQTELIWNVLNQYKKDMGLESVGMQYVIMTIKLLLCDYLPKVGVERLCDEMVNKCVELSGLKHSRFL